MNEDKKKKDLRDILDELKELKTAVKEGGAGGADAKSSADKSIPTEDEATFKAATHFFTDAQKAAQLRDFEQAAALGELALETLEPLKSQGRDQGYSKAYQLSVDSWIKQRDKEREIEDHATEWTGLSDDMIKENMRKKLDKLKEEGIEKKELLKKQRLFAEAHKQVKGAEGFKGALTIADDISNIVDEARGLGDVSKGDVFDQSKLERAIARLKQARQLCLNNMNEQYDSVKNPPKQEFWNQFIEVNALIDRYETDYERAFELFNLSEKPGDPFALKKLKISMDDQEVKQDHFDTLATKVANFTHTKDKTNLKHFIGNIGTKYKKDKGASNVLNHFNQYEQFEDCMQLSQEGDFPFALKALYELKKSCKNKEIAKIVDKSIKAVESGEPIPKAYLDDFLNEFVKDSTAESERARRTGEMMKEENYGARHIRKRDNRRDWYRGRALSGHEHWGEGGHAAVDALEWIGFERNPIETLGNLAATILTVWLVVSNIVGPILDVFSFFIPFIGILKIPIYLIAIIILHPFMKTILHPIKKDLHFLAGDPYWYKEGTSLHTARKITSDAEERREWVGRRKDQIGAGIQRGKDHAGNLRQKFRRKKTDDDENNEEAEEAVVSG